MCVLCTFTQPFIIQGVPWPESEKNAIDVVMQYAIQRLGFHIEDIILFSWSIGGYSSTFAAMSYPDIRYLVSLFIKADYISNNRVFH